MAEIPAKHCSFYNKFHFVYIYGIDAVPNRKAVNVVTDGYLRQVVIWGGEEGGLCQLIARMVCMYVILQS